MKRLLLFTLLLLTGILSAQDKYYLGVNGGIANVIHYPAGMAVTLEAGSILPNNLEATLSVSLIKSETDMTDLNDKARYMHIPVMIGFRYYFWNSFIRTYMGAEMGLSYFKNDVYLVTTDETVNPPVKTLTKDSYKGIYYGVAPNLGLMLPVTGGISLWVNGKIHFLSDSYGQYSSLSAGLQFQL
ncbi:MAG: DUF3575 domain-containing protein [Ignavibacteriales bacterium]